jgi:hypothetical protein
VAATHEIADSSLEYFTAGIFIFLQLDPFQTRLTGAPTAMQKLVEMHETPDSPLPDTDPAGVGWMVQVAPFHASTSARALRTLNAAPAFSPTATQNVAEAHDTDSSSGFAPAVGVGMIVHNEPSQRSADVSRGPRSVNCVRSKP